MGLVVFGARGFGGAKEATSLPATPALMGPTTRAGDDSLPLTDSERDAALQLALSSEEVTRIQRPGGLSVSRVDPWYRSPDIKLGVALTMELTEPVSGTVSFIGMNYLENEADLSKPPYVRIGVVAIVSNMTRIHVKVDIQRGIVAELSPEGDDVSVVITGPLTPLD